MKRFIIGLILMAISLTMVSALFGAGIGDYSSIGVIDLEKISETAEPFDQFQKEIAALEGELEEFKAVVYEEHTRKIRELTEEYKKKAADKSQSEERLLEKELEEDIQELATKTQERIDTRLQQLEEVRLQKQKELEEEMFSIIKKVADSKKVSIILHKQFSITGGRDLTDEVLKKWRRLYHPTWWDRFFQGFRKKDS